MSHSERHSLEVHISCMENNRVHSLKEQVRATAWDENSRMG
jgi:hypothetical protein